MNIPINTAPAPKRNRGCIAVGIAVLAVFTLATFLVWGAVFAVVNIIGLVTGA